MTMSTYGYSSLVGEWFGSIPLQSSERTPLAAVSSVIRRLRSFLQETHRPSRVSISWAEFEGGEEVAFHELEEYGVVDWADIERQVEAIRQISKRQIGISALAVELAVRIQEPGAVEWKENASSILLSIDQPELTPTTVEINYSTFIDAWLPVTYDEQHQTRDNRCVSELNAPVLEHVLRNIKDMTGDSFQVGHSQTYPFALKPTGFSEAP